MFLEGTLEHDIEIVQYIKNLRYTKIMIGLFLGR